MLDRADCADFGCHNSIRLETKHFLNTLALTFISFSGRFVFAMQKHYLFFLASDPLVISVSEMSHLNILPIKFQTVIAFVQKNNKCGISCVTLQILHNLFSTLPHLFKLRPQASIRCSTLKLNSASFLSGISLILRTYKFAKSIVLTSNICNHTLFMSADLSVS